MTPEEVLDAAMPNLHPELAELFMEVHAEKCAFAARHRFQVTHTTTLVAVADAKTRVMWNALIGLTPDRSVD